MPRLCDGTLDSGAPGDGSRSFAAPAEVHVAPEAPLAATGRETTLSFILTSKSCGNGEAVARFAFVDNAVASSKDTGAVVSLSELKEPEESSPSITDLSGALTFRCDVITEFTRSLATSGGGVTCLCELKYNNPVDMMGDGPRLAMRVCTTPPFEDDAWLRAAAVTPPPECAIVFNPVKADGCAMSDETPNDTFAATVFESSEAACLTVLDVT